MKNKFNKKACNANFKIKKAFTYIFEKKLIFGKKNVFKNKKKATFMYFYTQVAFIIEDLFLF